MATPHSLDTRLCAASTSCLAVLWRLRRVDVVLPVVSGDGDLVPFFFFLLLAVAVVRVVFLVFRTIWLRRARAEVP